MNTIKIPKLKLRKGDYFTVLYLMRNGIIINDGSFVGDTFICEQNMNGVITCGEVNKYRHDSIKRFSYKNFIHGVNAILCRIRKPLSEKQREILYKRAKKQLAIWRDAPELKAVK